MEQAINQFSKGLQMDSHPMLQGQQSLTDCLNGTLVTLNGNELILLNDMGNRRIDNAFLPSGYEPVGIKEYGGVIYIAAYNPITNHSLIGSFPSPQRKIDINDDSKLSNSLIYDDLEISNIDNDLQILVLLNDTILIPLSDKNTLHVGDKFVVYTDDVEDENYIKLNKKTISNYDNIEGNKVFSPKNKKYTLQIGVLNEQTNTFNDITNSLIRWEETAESKSKIVENLDNKSDLYKFNYGYFIPNSFTADTDIQGKPISDSNLIKSRQLIAANTFSYKLSGPLYLKAIYNHVTTFSYGVKGQLLEDGVALIFTGYFRYNCPDGVTSSDNVIDPDYYTYEEGTPNTEYINFDILNAQLEGSKLSHKEWIDILYPYDTFIACLDLQDSETNVIKQLYREYYDYYWLVILSDSNHEKLYQKYYKEEEEFLRNNTPDSLKEYEKYFSDKEKGLQLLYIVFTDDNLNIMSDWMLCLNKYNKIEDWPATEDSKNFENVLNDLQITYDKLNSFDYSKAVDYSGNSNFYTEFFKYLKKKYSTMSDYIDYSSGLSGDSPENFNCKLGYIYYNYYNHLKENPGEIYNDDDPYLSLEDFENELYTLEDHNKSSHLYDWEASGQKLALEYLIEHEEIIEQYPLIKYVCKNLKNDFEFWKIPEDKTNYALLIYNSLISEKLYTENYTIWYHFYYDNGTDKLQLLIPTKNLGQFELLGEDTASSSPIILDADHVTLDLVMLTFLTEAYDAVAEYIDYHNEGTNTYEAEAQRQYGIYTKTYAKTHLNEVYDSILRYAINVVNPAWYRNKISMGTDSLNKVNSLVEAEINLDKLNLYNQWLSIEYKEERISLKKIIYELQEEPTFSTSQYDDINDLYKVNLTKAYKFTQGAATLNNGKIEGVIGVYSGLEKQLKDEDGNLINIIPIYLKNLSSKFNINLGYLNSGKIKLVQYKFYNDASEQSTTMALRFEAYPKENQSFENLRLRFTNIQNNSEVLYLYTTLPLLNGTLILTFSWKDSFLDNQGHQSELLPRKVYSVEILYDTVENEISTETVYQENLYSIEGKTGTIQRWFLSTELFNNLYITEIADFCDTNNEEFTKLLKIEINTDDLNSTITTEYSDVIYYLSKDGGAYEIHKYAVEDKHNYSIKLAQTIKIKSTNSYFPLPLDKYPDYLSGDVLVSQFNDSVTIEDIISGDLFLLKTVYKPVEKLKDRPCLMKFGGWVRGLDSAGSDYGMYRLKYKAITGLNDENISSYNAISFGSSTAKTDDTTGGFTSYFEEKKDDGTASTIIDSWDSINKSNKVNTLITKSNGFYMPCAFDLSYAGGDAQRGCGRLAGPLYLLMSLSGKLVFTNHNPKDYAGDLLINWNKELIDSPSLYRIVGDIPDFREEEKLNTISALIVNISEFNNLLNSNLQFEIDNSIKEVSISTKYSNKNLIDAYIKYIYISTDSWINMDTGNKITDFDSDLTKDHFIIRNYSELLFNVNELKLKHDTIIYCDDSEGKGELLGYVYQF